jgi:hypothetical protein
MKKTVLLITFCLIAGIVKAGEYEDEIFPWIRYISSNDSTVWLLVDRSEGDFVTYRIDFDKSGRIRCNEEDNDSLYTNVENQYHNYCNWQKFKHPNAVRKADYDESGNLWEISGKYLSVTDVLTTSNVYMMPYTECIFHVRKNKGEVWVGGIHCFVAYYHRGAVLQIFFKDQYELMRTRIGFLKEGEECPEEMVEIEFDEDHIGSEVYRYGYHDSSIMSVVSSDSVCFCDNRKIGYIKDSNGFVNFRTAPNISAPITGIILDRVRIFYWDIEDNQDWYKVEINGVTGYVRKDNVS